LKIKLREFSGRDLSKIEFQTLKYGNLLVKDTVYKALRRFDNRFCGGYEKR